MYHDMRPIYIGQKVLELEVVKGTGRVCFDALLHCKRALKHRILCCGSKELLHLPPNYNNDFYLLAFTE